jgi:hypothetical protein
MSSERGESNKRISVNIKCLGNGFETCQFKMEGEITDPDTEIDLLGHTREVLLMHHEASRKEGWMSGYDRYVFTSTKGGKNMSGDIYVTEGGYELVQLTRFTINGKDIFNFT